MEISVFSDLPAINSCFARVEKTKSFTVKYHPVADLKKTADKIPADSVIYADVTGLAQPALKKNLTILSGSKRVFGIIDPKDSSSDPAIFFHSGASDYIGKGLFKSGIDSARIKKVYEFGKYRLPEQEAEAAPAVVFNAPLSGTDWKGITSGKEYTFSFMYIELDDQKEIKKRFSGKPLEDFAKKFHSFVDRPWRTCTLPL